MLHQLPPELIVTISSLLTLKDKLILITTCRQLFNLISKTNLYSELNILKHLGQQQDIIGKFINSRYPGAQVKRLDFELFSISDQLLSQLSTIFPNITEVRTDRFRRVDMYFEDRYTKGPMLKWSKTLQIFDLMRDWPEILPTLKTAIFSRLTDLTLSEPYKFDDAKEGFAISYFLPVFKNVPSLKKLRLENCALDLELLEAIHASCPHLEVLALYIAHIKVAKEYVLPPTILPADSLFSLSIKATFCFDINGLLLEYITRKYRCLKNIYVQLEWKYHPNFFNCYYRPVTDDDGDIDDDVVASEYITLYDSLKNELENCRSIYKESQSSFFSDLTITIESITIDNNLFDNIFQFMADLDIQPVKLNILGEMEYMSQIRYVQYIKKLNTLELMTQQINQIYTHSFEFPGITKLTIRTITSTVYIDWFLTAFPSLEELWIPGSSEFKIMGTIDKTKQFPNFWKLVAKISSISQKCVDYLTIAAPNMRTLDLISNQRTGLSNISIDLSGWELKELNLGVYEILRPVSFFCYISIQNITKVVEYDTYKQTLIAMKNSTFAYHRNAGVVSIVSTRQKQFKFNGFSISLSLDNIAIDFKK